MQRFAGTALKNLGNAYVNNSIVQDSLETALGAGVSAAGQAIFTDMTPEEIAMSTAAGAGLAMAARPVGGVAGRAVGRQMDKHMPMNDKDLRALSPLTREGMASQLKGLRQMGVPHDGVATVQGLLKAKRNQNAIRPDGTERGFYESLGGFYLRNYADNLTQGAVAVATPVMMNIAGMDNQQTIDQLGM